MIIPNEILKLIKEYEEKYNKKPRPWNYDEWDNFEQYRQYLEKELNK
ncbi:MAG: hypothetical protein HFJ34_04825 [Clostridia bacterium]|nr:hypothetical protein [Clostridia bacterium]